MAVIRTVVASTVIFERGKSASALRAKSSAGPHVSGGA